MNILRRLPTRQLIAVLAAAVAAIGTVTAVAIAAIGSGPVPAPKPLDQAIRDAANAPAVSGVSARIKFTNSLVDSSALGEGRGGNPLLKGSDGRLWVTNDGRLRLELFSSRGDSQLSIDGPARTFAFYDGSSNTVYQGTLPSHPGSGKTTAGGDTGSSSRADQPVSLKSIDDALARLAKHADVSGATATDIAHQAAYSVRISPKPAAGGMIGGLGIAWDAAHGVPLDVAVYAKGSSSPVLELRATNISFGPISASDLKVSVPSGAKVNQVDTSGKSDTASGTGGGATHKGLLKGAQGLSAVKAAVPFALDAPATLDNLSQASVRQLTVNGKPAALITYGEQLGTVAVLERAASAGSGSGKTPLVGGGSATRGLSLPTVNVNGATANVLPTALGTIVTFERNGISYTVAGSVPQAVAEAVARGL